jgi:hypothetical protein
MKHKAWEQLDRIAQISIQRTMITSNNEDKATPIK